MQEYGSVVGSVLTHWICIYALELGRKEEHGLQQHGRGLKRRNPVGIDLLIRITVKRIRRIWRAVDNQCCTFAIQLPR